MPTLTDPPATPSRTAGQDTFSADADAAWSWLFGTHFPELVALETAWGPGSPVCAVGGTANARALTTGLNLAALTNGMEIRFRLPAAGGNTGATTFNLDGLGAQPTVTLRSSTYPTGAALPSGYLMPEVWSKAIWDSTLAAWVVDRLPESFQDADETWTKLADGTLTQTKFDGQTATGWTTANGVGFGPSADLTWTYAVPFVGQTPAVTAAIFLSAAQTGGVTLKNAPGLTSVTYRPWAGASTAAAVGKSVFLDAVGRWY